jgi:hypothetical protein
MAGTVSEFGVFAYCAAIGFVAAATIANFYQWVTAERAELFSFRPTTLGIAFAVVLAMFCGPFLLVQRVVVGLRARQIAMLPALIGVVLAGMWSVCAGIFYVSLMLTA